MVSLDVIWNSYPNSDWEYVGTAIGIVAIVISLWATVMSLRYAWCAPSPNQLGEGDLRAYVVAYVALALQAILHVYVLALANLDAGVRVNMFWPIGTFFAYGCLIWLTNENLVNRIPNTTNMYQRAKPDSPEREMAIGVGAFVIWLVGSIISVAGEGTLDRVGFGFFYLAVGLLIGTIFCRSLTYNVNWIICLTVVRLGMLLVSAVTGQLFFFYFSITELVAIVIQLVSHMIT